MDTLLLLLLRFLEVYLLCIFVWALLSWYRGYNETVSTVRGFLDSIIEPYMRLFRGLIPPVQMGAAALDLSSILGIVVLLIARSILSSML